MSVIAIVSIVSCNQKLKGTVNVNWIDIQTSWMQKQKHNLKGANKRIKSQT